MWRFRLLLMAGVASAAFQPGAAHAQSASEEGEASEARLRSLSRSQRALLAPHLERGPVLLARFYDRHSNMPSISLASYVEASPETLHEIITAPADYPRMMPALDEVEVESTQGAQTAYAWTWQLALFPLRGRNVMTSYGGDARRGYRVEVRSTQGDLGQGRFLWRVHPAGEGRSLVVLSARTDMRGANYVADQLASGGRSVQRSITIALSTVMLLGSKREAESRAGHSAPEVSLTALERPPVNVRRLWPVLQDGDLVFLEMAGDAVQRVSLLARSSRDPERTLRVMTDPEEFGRSLVAGSRAEILERTDEGTLFEWGIPLPLVGVRGRMRLIHSAPQRVDVIGQSGSLRSSEWHFQAVPMHQLDTVVFGWSRYDMRETSPLFRRVIGDDAAFAQGLALATQVMVARSLRSRTRRMP